MLSMKIDLTNRFRFSIYQVAYRGFLLLQIFIAGAVYPMMQATVMSAMGGVSSGRCSGSPSRRVVGG